MRLRTIIVQEEGNLTLERSAMEINPLIKNLGFSGLHHSDAMHSIDGGGFCAMFQLMKACTLGGFRVPLAVLLILLTISFAPSTAAGQDLLSLGQRSKDKRLVISAGAFFVRFNSSYQYQDETTAERVFVDLEGQLDLPTTEIVVNLVALWRVSGRSYLVGGYSSFRRSSERRLLGETVNIGADTVGVDGVASATMDYDFVDIGYGYAFHRDERSQVVGKLGIHIFNIDSGFSIEGDFLVNQDSYSGEVSDNADFIAAFPLVGAVVDFQIGRRWIVHNLVDIVYLPIGNTQAVALSTVVAARFMIDETVGIQMGLSYNFERVKHKEEGVTQEIQFDFSGLTANLYLAF
jgi:hypothetical protein